MYPIIHETEEKTIYNAPFLIHSEADRRSENESQTKAIVVFEKNQQYYTKAFEAATCKAIKNYLMCLFDVKPDDPFGLHLDGKELTQAGMKEVLRRLCRQAGIPLHLFHDFRRYYGKALYDATHDIYLVSRALDHKDIYVTRRYIALDDREDAEAVRSYSPMDRTLRETGVKVQR